MIAAPPLDNRKIESFDEFLALPDDGAQRYVIRGLLRESRDPEMTMRNRYHSVTEARVTTHLNLWLWQQPEPRGETVSGEAGFFLRKSPLSISAGVDIAVITPEQARLHESESAYFEGAPLLIAEILSPTDTVEGVTERITDYLDCGVPVVWIMNPYQRYITIHRKGQPTVALGAADVLHGDPELPGFKVAVTDFFGSA